MSFETQVKPYLEKHLAWAPKENIIPFLTVALCGEAGELANYVKKMWRDPSYDDKGGMLKELADVANYTFMLAEQLGVNLFDLMEAKFKEVEARPSFQSAMRSSTVGN